MSPSGLLEVEVKAELVHVNEARSLVDAIYALDTNEWTDDDHAKLERVIDRAITLLSAMPNAEYRPLIERLLVAREGVEQGLSPDPARRPSDDELRAFVSAHL